MSEGVFMSVIGEEKREIWFLWFSVYLIRSEKLDFNLHLQLGRFELEVFLHLELFILQHSCSGELLILLFFQMLQLAVASIFFFISQKCETCIHK